MRSHRMPRWEHWLLNSLDEPVARLDGVTGGSVTLQGLTRLGGHGDLDLDERGQGIDWLKYRVQSIYSTGTESWPVSTMMLSSPTEHYAGGRVSYKVGLLSKVAIVDEDAFDTGYSLPAGANIIDAVTTVLESTGETRIAVTRSDATLSNPQAWEAGESKLTIVNDLLTAAGYWTLWADGSGQYRVEPYLDPADRSVSWEFVQGEASIHMPDWEREQDLSSVPNRFICVGQGDDEAPPLVGVAENMDPDSPFSFQARGRWITRREDGVEATDQAVITQIAQRRLLEQMSPVEHVKARHAVVPLHPNEAILFSDSGFTRRLTVLNMSIPFTDDADVSAEWRRIGV